MGGGGGSCWFRVGDAIDFEHFFNNKELSDVTLTIGQIKFHLHKLILVNSSDVFRTMLTHGHWEEAKTQEVTVEESDICQEFFPLFLKSLYSMSIELTEENICPLLTLYDKYMVGKHKEVCVEFMLNNLTVENVVVWYKFAVDLVIPAIQERCLEIISTNFADLSDHHLHSLDIASLKPLLQRSDLVVASERDVVNFIFDWLSAQRAKSPEQEQQWVVELICCARLHNLSPGDLLELERRPEVLAILPRVMERFYKGFKFCLYGSRLYEELTDVDRLHFCPRVYTSREHLLIHVRLSDRAVKVSTRRCLLPCGNCCAPRLGENMEWAVELWRMPAIESHPMKINMNLCPQNKCLAASCLTFKVVTLLTIHSPSCFPNDPGNCKKLMGCSKVSKFSRNLSGYNWIPLNINASHLIPAEFISSSLSIGVDVYLYCIDQDIKNKSDHENLIL